MRHKYAGFFFCQLMCRIFFCSWRGKLFATLIAIAPQRSQWRRSRTGWRLPGAPSPSWWCCSSPCAPTWCCWSSSKPAAAGKENHYNISIFYNQLLILKTPWTPRTILFEEFRKVLNWASIILRGVSFSESWWTNIWQTACTYIGCPRKEVPKVPTCILDTNYCKAEI